jgi:hypothetical protein
MLRSVKCRKEVQLGKFKQEIYLALPKLRAGFDVIVR